MSVVSPFAPPREIADALNRIASKIGTGAVTLGSAETTGVIDARISPATVITLQPFSAGGDAGNIVVQCGDGVATLTHGTGRAGQEYRFVIVNL